MTENEEWLAVAESAFDFWDNPQDAMYDDIEFWVDLGRQYAEYQRLCLFAIEAYFGRPLKAGEGAIGGG